MAGLLSRIGFFFFTKNLTRSFADRKWRFFGKRRWSKQYTALRAWLKPVFFVYIVSKTFIVSLACHVSHVAWPATDFTFAGHSFFIFSGVLFSLACRFHSANWSLVWPVCRTVSAHNFPEFSSLFRFTT